MDEWIALGIHNSILPARSQSDIEYIFHAFISVLACLQIFRANEKA